MLHSLLGREQSSVEVHLFVEREVPSSEVGRIADMVRDLGGSISLNVVPYELIGDLGDCAPPASWLRVFLPEVLTELDRVLYLDSDLIVTDSLRPLWDLDLAGACVGAVTTVFPSPEWGEVHCSAMGLRTPRLYFNSGVLLMDLKELRAGGYVRQVAAFALAHASPALTLQALKSGNRADDLREYARVHPDEMLFGDQDALSAVLSDRRLVLHPRWNCMNQVRLPWGRDIFGEREVSEALEDPAIIHFEGVGNAKPWDPDAEPSARELYLRHRNGTPWPADISP